LDTIASDDTAVGVGDIWGATVRSIAGFAVLAELATAAVTKAVVRIVRIQSPCSPGWSRVVEHVPARGSTPPVFTQGAVVFREPPDRSGPVLSTCCAPLRLFRPERYPDISAKFAVVHVCRCDGAFFSDLFTIRETLTCEPTALQVSIGRENRICFGGGPTAPHDQTGGYSTKKPGPTKGAWAD